MHFGYTGVPDRRFGSVQTVLNHYDILGVEATADLETIRRAWRVKLQLLHPDRHSGAPHDVLVEAARETKRVNGAWETLKDPARRRRYDLQLARKGGPDPTPPKSQGSWRPPPRPDAPGVRNVRVTCSMCSTHQEVPRSAGRYVCAKCNTAWQFAKCEGCHKIAHVRERRTSWRCESCGRQQSSSWGGGAGRISCVRCNSRTGTPAGAHRVKCGTCGLEHVRCACGHFTTYLGLPWWSWRCLKCKRINRRSPNSSFDLAMVSIVVLALLFVVVGVALLAGMAQ